MKRGAAPSFPYEPAAAEARRAQTEVHRTFAAVTNRRDADHPATRAWQEAIAAFRRALGAALPPGFGAALANVREAEPHGGDVDLLIGFLEADPIFFRSGYLKARVAASLRRVKFSAAQRARLVGVVLQIVDRRASQEFSAYRRLAFAADGPDLRAGLSERLSARPAGDEGPARRARWMLDYLQARARELDAEAALSPPRAR